MSASYVFLFYFSLIVFSWNESQVFYFQEVAKAYIHHTLLFISLRAIRSNAMAQGSSIEEQHVARECMLAVWTTAALGLIVAGVENYLEGGYITGAHSRAFKSLLLLNLKNLRPHALELVNVVSPPDWVVWAPLGLKANQPIRGASLASSPGSAAAPSHASDQTYDNFFHAITHFQSTYERAPYWQLLRQPVPIIGQPGGRFGSTPPQEVHFGTGPAAATLDSNTTGKAKL
jgi:hypothetical protein